MFLGRKKKNNVYPCKPQFYYIKVGFKGSKSYRHVFVMGNEGQVSCEENYLKPPPLVVFLLTIPMWFLICSSSLFLRLWFHILHLFCHCLFLFSPSFGTVDRLCFSDCNIFWGDGLLRQRCPVAFVTRALN